MVMLTAQRSWGINLYSIMLAKYALQMSKYHLGRNNNKTVLVAACLHEHYSPLPHRVIWPGRFSNNVLGNMCSNHCDVTETLVPLNFSHTLHKDMQQYLRYHSAKQIFWTKLSRWYINYKHKYVCIIHTFAFVITFYLRLEICLIYINLSYVLLNYVERKWARAV